MSKQERSTQKESPLTLPSVEEILAIFGAGMTAIGGVFALGKQKQRIDTLEEDMKDVPARLVRVETKLDSLIEHIKSGTGV